MSPKISKRARADAVLICAICASTPGVYVGQYDAVMAVLGLEMFSDALHSPASRLAFMARSGAVNRLGWDRSRQELYAEAEALLQTGWCP